MSLAFTLIRVPGRKELVKTFVSPQAIRLLCPDCKWTGTKTTRIPAGENQHPCPNGCGHVKETAA